MICVLARVQIWLALWLALRGSDCFLYIFASVNLAWVHTSAQWANLSILSIFFNFFLFFIFTHPRNNTVKFNVTFFIRYLRAGEWCVEMKLYMTDEGLKIVFFTFFVLYISINESALVALWFGPLAQRKYRHGKIFKFGSMFNLMRPDVN